MPPLFTVTLIQLFVGLVLFIALLNGQRDLAVLALLVLGVVSATRLWARLSLTGLNCHLAVDKRRVFPGEKLNLRIGAENAKVLPIWLELLVPIGNLLQHSTGQRVLTKQSSLLWYQGAQFHWELVAERRGVYQIGPLYILAGDLFSFFQKHQRAKGSHSIIVYPRLVPLKSLSLSRRDFFGVPRAKSPVQDPIYILGTRDYQQGQPSKYIHWKASARHNRLQEKVFDSSVHEKVLLVVNVDSFARSNAEEDYEHALETVASLAVRLDQQGHSVGLVANGAAKGRGSAIVPVARNDQQLPALLEMLARLEMKPAGDLKALLRRSLALAWGISCVYFSHAADETIFSAKEYFAQRQTPVVFVVCQPRPRAGEDGRAIPSEIQSEGQRKVYYLSDLRAIGAESK